MGLHKKALSEILGKRNNSLSDDCVSMKLKVTESQSPFLVSILGKRNIYMEKAAHKREGLS